MQLTDFFNLFLIISAVYGFVFSFILFYSKNGKDKSMRYLNLLILAISFNNLQSWVLATSFFQNNYMLAYLQIPWHFLIAPFFYMFLVNYLSLVNKTIRVLNIVSPLFFIAILVQISFVLVHKDSGTLLELKTLFEKYNSIEEIVSFVVSITVFSYAYYILKKKRELYATLLSYDKLQWIYTFFKIGIVCYFLWIIALVVKVSMNFSGFLFSYYPLRIATTLLIFWIGYQAIIQLQILKDRKNIRKNILIERIVVKVPVTQEKSSDFLKIHDYISLHKKYTDSKLSRDALAKEMRINKNKLSAIINKETQKTFREYINELRVNFAIQLLVDEKYQKYTITAIGLESGFNSKSTFYSVFKKYTGKTPLQFKEENS